MPWRDAVAPARMDRVAVVAPANCVRAVLRVVADAGIVELERDQNSVAGPARRAWERSRRRIEKTSEVLPELRPEDVDLTVLERERDMAALAGEAELEEVRQAGIDDATITAFVGWCPSAGVDALALRVTGMSGAVVRLPAQRGAQPPTLLQPSPARAFQRLVDTYTTVPYRDVNPSIGAGLAYVAMFGMMFGDVGHGTLLVAFGAVLLWWRSARLARLRWAVPFVLGAGLASIAFGLAYGEAFGPTGLVPTLWMRPLDHATTLLAVALAVGAVLLGAAYGLGTVNRWREAGAAGSLVALSGVAGVALYAGLALVGLAWSVHLRALGVGGACVVAAGLVLGFSGQYAEAGGRATGAVQAGVEVLDAGVRLVANTFSFARLAAFGLTHAALVGLIWSGTRALWHHGPGLWAPAAVLFVVGNAVAFALEGLVAGIQALRLEYYELFSRVFVGQGRTFRPWHLRVLASKEG